MRNVWPFDWKVLCTSYGRQRVFLWYDFTTRDTPSPPKSMMSIEITWISLLWPSLTALTLTSLYSYFLPLRWQTRTHNTVHTCALQIRCSIFIHKKHTKQRIIFCLYWIERQSFISNSFLSIIFIQKKRIFSFFVIYFTHNLFQMNERLFRQMNSFCIKSFTERGVKKCNCLQFKWISNYFPMVLISIFLTIMWVIMWINNLVAYEIKYLNYFFLTDFTLSNQAIWPMNSTGVLINLVVGVVVMILFW